MPGERPPFDVKRQIADVIAKLSTFKERIGWNLVRDLKPRVLVGMKSDGTPVDIHDAAGYPKVAGAYRGVLKKASHDKADGTTAFLAVPAGKVWEVLTLQATFLCDATVAARTCEIFFPELGLGGIAGTTPTSLLNTGTQVALAATEYGYITMVGGLVHVVHVCTNGTITTINNANYPTVWLNEGADIQAKISANPQATDKSGIDILYREYDLEA